MTSFRAYRQKSPSHTHTHARTHARSRKEGRQGPTKLDGCRQVAEVIQLVRTWYGERGRGNCRDALVWYLAVRMDVNPRDDGTTRPG